MARGRMIDKNIRKSKKFRDLKTDKARLLYLMVYPHADREGRFTADPEEVKIECIPYLAFSHRQIAETLIDMHNVGLITLAGHEGRPYFEISRFRDFNKIRDDREATSEFPAVCRSTPGAVREYARLIKVNIKEANIMNLRENDPATTNEKIYFDFKDSEFKNISEDEKSVWEKAYPACDIEAEINKMAAWLAANPTRKKANYKRFITNWLSRQQDRGGSKTNGTEKWTPKEPQPWED